MKKRIGLSPDLHKMFPALPDVTKGGSFDITIRLTHETGPFWAMYEGKSSIITVGTPEKALAVVRKLCNRFEVINQTPTRTLLKLLRKW